VVKGLERFRDSFANYADQYTLIGGVACEFVLEEAGIDFRVTKDFDIVLCVEALTPEFVAAFWRFIREGEYEDRFQGMDQRQYYRFQKPRHDGFPVMLELFSRKPDALAIAEGSHLTPIPTDDAASSLSAILLNDAYYRFIHSGRRILNGLSIVGAEHLLSLKARAWCELTDRKARGDSVDSRDIRKHLNDVFRLYPIIDPDFQPELPVEVRNDLIHFLEAAAKEDVNLKQLGLPGRTLEEVLADLRDIYGLR